MRLPTRAQWSAGDRWYACTVWADGVRTAVCYAKVDSLVTGPMGGR